MEKLLWEVAQMPVVVGGNIAESYKAICRTDNGSILHIPKKMYTPTKNETFMNVAERLVDITNFEHCGYAEFEGGKKVLAFLKNNEKVKICDFDFDDYMVIGNSHDGSSAFFIGSTTTMIRCQNQFTHANRNMKAYHKLNNEVRIKEIVNYFELYQESKIQVSQKMEQMQKVKINNKILSGMIANVLNINLGRDNSLGDIEDVISTRKKNLIYEIELSISKETSELGENMFGLFNGITHWTTHVRKGEKVFGNCLGTNSQINKRAFEFATS